MSRERIDAYCFLYLTKPSSQYQWFSILITGENQHMTH